MCMWSGFHPRTKFEIFNCNGIWMAYACVVFKLIILEMAYIVAVTSIIIAAVNNLQWHIVLIFSRKMSAYWIMRERIQYVGKGAWVAHHPCASPLYARTANVIASLSSSQYNIECAHYVHTLNASENDEHLILNDQYLFNFIGIPHPIFHIWFPNSS